MLTRICSLTNQVILGLPLVLLLEGCTGQHPVERASSTAQSESIELKLERPLVTTRILVLADGAARIDLERHGQDAIGAFPRTFIIPACSIASKRLVTSAYALLDAPEGAPFSFDRYGGSNFTYMLVCHHSGNSRTLRNSTQEYSDNAILYGLLEEIEIVAQVDLAQCLYNLEIAEEFLARGLGSDAVTGMDDSIEDFTKWEGMFTLRHVDGIWEQTRMKSYDFNGEHIGATGPVNSKLIRRGLVNRTPSDATVAKIASMTLREGMRGDIEFKQVNGVTIVTYDYGILMSNRHYIPASVPSEVEQILRRM